MDSVTEIKARLSIEELVGSYTQLTKKGRNFVGLCPFHNDSKPSMLVSPDKGIAYCFPCQKGGDIFSFYQLIENVDFPQALRELAERTGVKIEKTSFTPEKQDEKERLRACSEAASAFFLSQLGTSAEAQAYLMARGVTPEEKKTFDVGFAPNSHNALYDHLLKQGFSKTEIVRSGLAVQRDLREERPYDRFRGRIMFAIRDVQNHIIGFGGRTIVADDAKYMNTSDGPLYRKSAVLFGIHAAREAMREKKAAIVVEGYFDVLACHRVGVKHVVATCGTALTEEHARILKRTVETVILCLDSDDAGKAAAERAFVMLSREQLQVRVILLPDKDPADTVLEQPELLKQILLDGGVPYIESVFEDIRVSDMSNPVGRRKALERLAVIYEALATASERQIFVQQAGPLLGVSETQVEGDLRGLRRSITPAASEALVSAVSPFSPMELALGLFLLYPRFLPLLKELIPPEEGLALALHAALSKVSPESDDVLAAIELTPEDRERTGILHLFCEEHGFGQWSESLAAREIRRNCVHANREMLRRKQQEISRRLLSARKAGSVVEEELLRTQYQQLLKLSKMAL